MSDYTEIEKNMFEKKVYNILKNAEVVISEVTLEYLLTLPKEDLKILNDLALYYGSDELFETIGKAKIQLETKNIRSLAEHWRAQKEINPKAKAPNIHQFLKEEIEKLDISQNLTDIIQFQSQYLSEAQKREIANIAVTDINEVKIHDNYQMNLFALDFPLFSLKLNKKADTFRFKNSQDVEITLRGTELGRATIQDADLWLYCITKMMQLIYEKKINTRRVTFTGYDFLKSTGRKINGGNYSQILKSLERLSGTRLSTNKTIETWEVGAGLGLLDSFSYIKNRKTGKVEYIEVVLPQWLYCEITTKRIAKINPEYLRLKPFEKRIYHIAKRHCQKYSISKPINLDYFTKKVGSSLIYSRFKFEIKKLTQSQPLPEYLIHFDDEKDQVYFTHRDIKNISDQESQTTQQKERKRKLAAKAKRENIEQQIQSSDMFPISNGEAVRQIFKFIEREYFDKKYPIFDTQILTERKLAEYLRKFEPNYLLSKIREFIDYDFSQKENPEGYFFGVLKKGIEQ
ncbi:MAG: replication initiator protein A [Neisseriaceae bacterium]|nr:replication initiator protein A [Neisseriaceae bacterium]